MLPTCGDWSIYLLTCNPVLPKHRHLFNCPNHTICIVIVKGKRLPNSLFSKSRDICPANIFTGYQYSSPSVILGLRSTGESRSIVLRQISILGLIQAIGIILPGISGFRSLVGNSSLTFVTKIGSVGENYTKCQLSYFEGGH